MGRPSPYPRSDLVWPSSPISLDAGLAYTYEITELEPGRRMVMRTAEGPFPMETTYTWEDAPIGATRMTLRNRGRPSGFSRILAPVMALAIRRAIRKDLRRLKRILESRGSACG